MGAGDQAWNVVGIVAGSGVIGIGGYYGKNRKAIKDRKSSRDVKSDKVYEILVGEEKSPLNPNPAPGLVAKVDENRKQIMEQGKAVAELTGAVKTLVSKFDDRATSFNELSSTVSKMSAGFEERLGVFNTIIERVSNLEESMGRVDTGVSTLVADSQTNGGSSSRDSLDRIEESLGTKPPSPDDQAA